MGQKITSEEQDLTLFWVKAISLFKDFSRGDQSIHQQAKTMMKIVKKYWFGAKKYTSEAKIILLKQYTFIWKFGRNTPANTWF